MRQRPHRPTPSSLVDEGFYRFGVGILGAFTGGLVAVFVHLAQWLIGVVPVPLSNALAAGAAAGAACGAVFPALALNAAFGLSHFIYGAVSALGGISAPDPEPEPPWLLSAFAVGILYTAVFLVLA
jgi:hypothetical protein